jgi:lysosomal acid lipase/cholesteryl ester hydrolase
MLDYVMNITGQKEMFYAGHSQGTVMGFAGFTANQTLAQHIKAFFALAPVSTVKHVKGLFAFMSDFYKEVEVKIL